MRLFRLFQVLIREYDDGCPASGLQSLWPSQIYRSLAVVVACGTGDRESIDRPVLIQDRFRATPNPIDNKKFTRVWHV